MKKVLLLGLILIAAFLVRAIGINFGLPFVYHDDEPIIVNYALAYGSGDFNPHVFKVSPFLSYLLFFVYGLFFVIGYIFRYFHNVRDFAYLFLNNPAIFYLIGRALYGLAFGTASVFLLYILGKRYFDKKTAFLATLFFALNYLHVRDSHYIYFDVPLTFFILLFFIKAYDFLKPPAERIDYVLLGILLAVASSVKYSGALLGLPFLIVLIYSLYVSGDKKISSKVLDIFYCAAAFAAVMFLLNPFSFINFKEFTRSLSKMPVMQLSPHFHLKVSLFEGCGIAAVALGIGGMLWAILRRRKRQALLVLYVAFYYFILNRGSQEAERLVMPLIPFILLFASSVIIEARTLLIKRKILSNALTLTAIAILVYPSLIRIYYSDRLFLREDTRTTAHRWIKQNIAKDSRIALDATSSWFPKLQKSKEQSKDASKYFDIPQFDKPKGADSMKLQFILSNPHYPTHTYYLFYLKEKAGTAFVSVHPDLPTDYLQLKSNKIQYVVLSHILIDGRYDEFLEDIEKNCKLIKAFSPYKSGITRVRPKEASLPPAAAFMLDELKDRKSYGPVIEIFKTKY